MTNDTIPDDQVQALEKRLALYDRATRLARCGIWDCDLDTEHLTWSPGVYELFEFTSDKKLRRPDILGLYTDESRADMEAMRAEAIRQGGPLGLDVRIRTCAGALRWMRLSIDVWRHDGRAVRLFGTKQDVTALLEAFARLREMAEQDCLTGLANRRTFEARYNHVVADEIHDGRVSALVLIDLDRFKSINDEFGHLAGDECLRQAALRLQRAFRNASLLARIGGDEFAVLLPATLRPDAVRHLLQRASAALNRPIVLGARSITIGASIGATLLGRPHVRKRSELFAEADAALYTAKAAGRNTLHVFGDREDPWARSAKAMAREIA